jgi:hypothetical protein
LDVAQVFTGTVKIDAWVESGASLTIGWKVEYGDLWWFNAHPMTFLQDSFPQELEIDRVRFKAEGPPLNMLWARVTVTNANHPDGCRFALYVARTSG